MNVWWRKHTLLAEEIISSLFALKFIKSESVLRYALIRRVLRIEDAVSLIMEHATACLRTHWSFLLPFHYFSVSYYFNVSYKVSF